MMLNSDIRGPLPHARLVAATKLPTRYGTFELLGYEGPDGEAHAALTMGLDERDHAEPVLVRVHSECLTGDALGSYRCDCGEQLEAAMETIGNAGAGVCIYVRGHEGRGIGLLNKLRAYALQDEGMDTVDANTHLGLPVDARSYEQSAAILRSLGVEAVHLLSSNPAKQESLEKCGITVVTRGRLTVVGRAENSTYLATKRARMGHDYAEDTDPWESLIRGVIPADASDEAFSKAPGVGLSPEQRKLVDRYRPLLTEKLVIAQLGQSQDGFIASRTGDARFVTGAEDREHLHRLRALVDAVVVGAQTVSSDDCQLTVRAVSGENPVRVVIDPRARIPRDARVLTDGSAPTLWIIAGPGNASAEPVPTDLAAHVQVHQVSDPEGFAPHALVETLADRGYTRVLIEGGGRTVSKFVQAGAVDRLFLTTAPLLIGDGVPGLRFDGADALSGAVTAPTRRFTFGSDTCTEFDFAAARAATPQEPHGQHEGARENGYQR